MFVGNLDYATSEGELTSLLSAAGQIVDVYLPSDRATGRPRGFAFVEFSSENEASEAVRMFNGYDLNGRQLNINPAEDRPPRVGGPPGPGGFGGHSGGGGGGGGGGGIGGGWGGAGASTPVPMKGKKCVFVPKGEMQCN